MTAVLTRPLPRTQPVTVVRTDDAPAASSPPPDIVELWGIQSFPASDPPSNW